MDEPLKYFEYFVVRATHPNQKVWGSNYRQGKRHFAKSEELESKTLCNMIVRYIEKNFDFESPMLGIYEPKDGAGSTCKQCWSLSPKIERSNLGRDIKNSRI